MCTMLALLQVLRKLPGTGTECDCVLVRVKRLCSTRVCTSELCIAGPSNARLNPGLA